MPDTYYIIYKTINQVNDKIYIGKHKTSDLNDDYLGSGKLLNLAIKKYGRENFTKEVLFVFDNEAEMNAKERELVTEEFVLQETNYNLCVGGRGGWSYVNREVWNDETRIQHNKKVSGFHSLDRSLYNYKEYSEKGNEKRREMIDAGLLDPKTFAGRNHSAETKQKMSESKKQTAKGQNNSQFGTYWITDGRRSAKIKNTDIIPDGWYRGRTIQSTHNKRSSVMKCVKQGTEVKRVSNDAANTLVKEGKAQYVPKNVWKKEVRDAQQ